MSEAKYGSVDADGKKKKPSFSEKRAQDYKDFMYLLSHSDDYGNTYYCYKTPVNWIEYMIFLIIGWAIAIGVWVAFFFISMNNYHAPYYYGLVFLGLCVVLLFILYIGHIERIKMEEDLARIRDEELKKFQSHH